jgi:hypothetical protein
MSLAAATPTATLFQDAALVICPKGVMAAWRYDTSSDSIPLDMPCHPYISFLQSGRGFENSVFVNLTA